MESKNGYIKAFRLSYIDLILIGVLILWELIYLIIAGKKPTIQLSYFSMALYCLFYLYFFTSAIFELLKYGIKRHTAPRTSYLSLETTLRIAFYLILSLCSYSSFYYLGRNGVLIFLSLMLTGLIYLSKISIANLWEVKHIPFVYFLNSIIYVVVLCGVFYYPIKESYCYEFGVEKIGASFEKAFYESEYYVKIRSVKDEDNEPKLEDSDINEWNKKYEKYWDKREKLAPAKIFISKDLADYFEAGDEEHSSTYKVRKVKVQSVKLNKGELIFNDCIIPIKGESDNRFMDQNGNWWQVILTDNMVNKNGQ